MPHDHRRLRPTRFGAALAIAWCGVAQTVWAQEASGHINARLDGVDVEWAIVAAPEPGLITADDDAMTSVLSTASIFVPQKPPFDKVVTIAMWGAATHGDAAPLTLQFLHPLSDDTPLGDSVIGGLYLFEGGTDWGWSADFEDPGAEIIVDSYQADGDLLAISGHFSVRAYYLAMDQDETDPTRSIDVSGTFDAQLPRQDAK